MLVKSCCIAFRRATVLGKCELVSLSQPLPDDFRRSCKCHEKVSQREKSKEC